MISAARRRAGIAPAISPRSNKRPPQLEMCLREVRIQIHSPPRGVRRCRRRTGGALDPGQIDQRLRKLRNDVQRAFDQRDGLIEFAAILQNQTEQV